MDTKKKRFSKGKAAVLLSVCAVTALCVNLANSCSGDEDYDKYRGDELQTHAASTRSVSEENGTALYVGSYVPGGHTLYFSHTTDLKFTYSNICLQWSSGYTGNVHGPYSAISIQSITPETEDKEVWGWINNTYTRYKLSYHSCYVAWGRDDQIIVTFTYKASLNGRTYNDELEAWAFTLQDIAQYVTYDELPDSVNTSIGIENE